MIFLKYNTADQTLLLGPFVDETDGFTAETGLTISNTDIKLHKYGTLVLANKYLGGATHVSGGIYKVTFGTYDTNTLGPMRIFVHVSGARPIVIDTFVVYSDAFDFMITNDKPLGHNASYYTIKEELDRYFKTINIGKF